MSRSQRPAAGLTLIEVLMGTLLVGLVLVSGSWALSHVASSKSVHEEDPIFPALMAREIFELATTLPTAPSGAGPAGAPGEVIALDTLDGASFSPPIDSSPATQTSLVGWSQLVKLSVHEMSDLSGVASADFASTAVSAGALYKLTVTIRYHGLDKGSWSWWLNP